jgi:hypothetical protein
MPRWSAAAATPHGCMPGDATWSGWPNCRPTPRCSTRRSTTLRKLETLESIYDKLSNEQNSRRAELLEWIIIVLIASEIVFAFLGVLKP